MALAAVLGIATWRLRDSPPAPASEAGAAGFVGSAACAECHAAQFATWQPSHHALAMQAAAKDTVAGNFADARFRYGSIETTFFERDGKPVVRTDGPDGKLADFAVSYTFGVDPLQQYLIALPGGKFQALSLAWDSRDVAQGGQRWFHLYPSQKIDAHDELHWTKRAQNWNFMCADCHSTDVRKNYDATTDTFKTTWTELSVGCESCHGPGSAHLAWARSGSHDPDNGLTVALDERRGARWAIDPSTGNAVRSRDRKHAVEVEVCAPCHSRRAQIAEGWRAGKLFLDYYNPSLLEAPLYFADGQQRGEVYVWGSFLQSKMFNRGVTCSDCHEPHGAKLRVAGNALCGQCHSAGKYDTPAHHHHTNTGAGTRCVDCHMPSTNYMVIDARPDHSLRIPRPDLSVSLGTPNACNGCHHDRSAQWAADMSRSWFGHPSQGFQRYARAFAAAEHGAPGADAALAAVVADLTQPTVARATALDALSRYPSPRAFELGRQATFDEDALVRHASISVLGTLPMVQRWTALAPLLEDRFRAVRIDAAAALAGEPAAATSAAWRTAAAQFEETQRYLADRPEARVALGTFYARQNRIADAESLFRSAIALEPSFVPAYIDLADLLRVQRRDDEGERALRDGLAMEPRSAILHYALGLARVRLRDATGALASFRTASQLAPEDAHFGYVYAVALNANHETPRAIAEIDRGLARHPDDRDLLEAAVAFRREIGDRSGAAHYARLLADRNAASESIAPTAR
jgi:predicted CXXCH cytochrome family protein